MTLYTFTTRLAILLKIIENNCMKKWGFFLYFSSISKSTNTTFTKKKRFFGYNLDLMTLISMFCHTIMLGHVLTLTIAISPWFFTTESSTPTFCYIDIWHRTKHALIFSWWMPIVYVNITLYIKDFANSEKDWTKSGDTELCNWQCVNVKMSWGQQIIPIKSIKNTIGKSKKTLHIKESIVKLICKRRQCLLVWQISTRRPRWVTYTCIIAMSSRTIWRRYTTRWEV